MTLFPKIARPCPYVDRLDAVMEGDFCRMCQREVHDLTDMDLTAREAFLADCGGQACVRYTVWMKPAMAAAALAASAGGMSVLAASLDPPAKPVRDQPGSTPIVVAGGLVQLAGKIAPSPQPGSEARERRQTGAPKIRPPKPVPPVEVEMPYVLAGVPALPEPEPDNAAAPPAKDTEPGN